MLVRVVEGPESSWAELSPCCRGMGVAGDASAVFMNER